MADEDAKVRALLDASVELKPSTRKVYLAAIQRSAQITGQPLVCVWMRPLASFNALDLALRPRSVYTLLTTVAGITAVMGHVRFASDAFPSNSFKLEQSTTEDRKRVQRQWTRIHETLSKEVDELRSSGRPYGRQAQLVLSWSAVVAKDMELRKTYGRGSPESLLSSFYVHLEPRRQADYHRIFIQDRDRHSSTKDDEEEPAVLDLDTGTLTVHQFKRSDAQGPWTKTLPPSVLDDVRRSLIQRPRKYVFCFPDGRPFNVDNFTKFHNRHLKAWFGESASNNMLRHARATAVHRDPTLSHGDKRRIAADMGHSLDMSMSYSLVVEPGPPTKGESLVLATLDGKKMFACRRGKNKEQLVCTPSAI
jgi:hypothetical protein